MSDNAYTVTIDKFSHDGRGIASIDGKIVFVWGALVGETVEVRILRKHRQFLEATVVKVLEASEHRVTPRCPHFGVCGGCSLQHLDAPQQILMKQSALLDQLQRTSQLQPETVLPPITGPKWGYRHKARLGVKFVLKKDKLLIGFREQNSRYLADLEVCHVLPEAVGTLLPALRQLIASTSIERQVPQIEVAVGDDKTAIVIRHLQPFAEADLQSLKAFGEAHAIEVYLQPKGPKTIHKLTSEAGEMRLHYTVDGLSMAFHPADFTQVNPEINQSMVAKAMELLQLEPSDTVLDLFCGLGNFSLPIAKRSAKVVGVEGSEEMVERAYENAKRNQLSNVEFHAADLSQSLDSHAWAKARYNKVLLDPPRSGAQALLPVLQHWQPSRIVYVSCNPATLARDAGLITQMGYHLSEAGILDMFPHTSHVESIAVFIKE